MLDHAAEIGVQVWLRPVSPGDDHVLGVSHTGRTCTRARGGTGSPRRPPGTGRALSLSIRGRGHLCPVTVTSVRWPHGETSVGLEAWGAEGPSAGERVCLGEAEAASGAAAAAAGHGGREAGVDGPVPGDGG